ncbi:MAG TPA: (d)CMP kinase [Crocinitomix sp.]|nr:(d)CMP kinase [Crocinitomix sp.]
MKQATIAIDGYSSCGKSTLAKEIAKKLNYRYVDSGAMYRAVTYYLIKNGILKDGHYLKESVLKSLPKILIDFSFNREKGISETILNGINVEKQIRSLEISKQVSPISTIKEVREKLVSLQQKMGKKGGVVMDGRDIGTVVFPNAEIKLFMTASTDIRAERRYKELIEKGQKVNLDEVRHSIQKRDYIDTTREISPLMQANDAVVIDNTELSKEEQLELALNIINEKINKLATT